MKWTRFVDQCSQLRLFHGAMPAKMTLTATTSQASVQEYDLSSAGNDTIKCSFETAHLSNYAAPRSARGS